MSHYLYKCFSCKSEYSISDVEDNLIYLCPKCGSSEKNKPLNGVLQIEYDYKNISKLITKETFLNIEPGSIWEYPYLWPLAQSDKNLTILKRSVLNNLILHSKPITPVRYNNRNLMLFDDSHNPTLSYKDRASILVAVKAMQLGIKEISAASTGNAGSSLAGICARLGIKSHVFVPKNIPDSKRIQIQAFGANIFIVDGDYDKAFDLCLDISNKKKWYNRNTAYNPLTIEGKKSSVFDMFLQLNGVLPKNIFVPVGDGVIISGIYKGLSELLKLNWIDCLPRLIGIQAEGSDALIRYLDTQKFEFKNANTSADSICAGAPRNLYMAADAIKSTNGIGIRVSDEEIFEAQRILAERYGVLAEPAASASFAGYMKLEKIENETLNDSLLMITGNGLKDINALSKWNEMPRIKNYSSWKEELS